MLPMGQRRNRIRDRRLRPASQVSSWVNFNPLSLSPALWLDAADTATITASSGSVSQWDDKSGNGRNFTQGTGANQPTTGTRTLNGLNVVDFARGRFVDGGDVLDLGSGGFTIFGVAKFDDTSNSSPWGKNFAGTLNGRYGLVRTAGSIISVYQFDGSVAGAVTVTDSSLSARYFTQLLVRQGAGSSNTLRANGSQLATTTFTDPGTSWNISPPWRVGRYGTSTSFDFDGYVAEIIVLMRSATMSEIVDAEGYLATKWGL